jgi:tripartite-type tricarboxylate transporter receptor subunit TctC
LVRYFAEKVDRSPKSIIVENKVGAGGYIALEYVARAKPDGYTVFVHAGSGAAASMSLLKAPSVDVPRQIQVAGTINRQPYMIVVHQSKPYKTLAELTAAMKEKGDKATYGTSNPSSTILAEIYRNTTGVKAVQVDYKTGADMVNDLASGQLDFASADPVQALSMQQGRLADPGHQQRAAPASHRRLADHGRAGRAHGRYRMVGRHGSGWCSERDPRSDQQMVRASGRIG